MIYCSFEQLHPGRVYCRVCGRTVSTPHAPEIVYAPCRSGIIGCAKKTKPVGGAGTELKKLFAEKGGPAPCSACRALARQMDAWGPDECGRRRAEIVEAINANWREMEADEKRKAWVAGIRAALSGYFGVGSLVDEAIRRARANAEQERGS